MIIPSPVVSIDSMPASDSWSELGADEKRERLLRSAGEVFASHGLEAPMPAIALAAGAGVGSVYRQFSSKRDLVAALVIERLSQTEEDTERALATDGPPWQALTDLIATIAERQVTDQVLAEAIATVSERADVKLALAGAVAALERLLAAARKEGGLREDATVLDLRLLFAAIRAAAKLEAGAWRRMLELGIDALRSGKRPSGKISG